ncbi:MAG TPA: type II secretion system F family protein [Planctomycetota bacterium]|jgi:type IV pilus assembly protein PilC|nr:type II secretion system F family protein [Planctomycetota bacterium]
MPVFAYDAIDANGQKISREVNASSKDDAIKQIRAQGLRPTKVQVKAAKPAPAAGGAKKKKGLILFDRVKQAQIVTFTSQLSTLQDAGLPIVRSVKILEGQQRPGKFKDQLAAVSDDVEQGSTFSEALAKFPKSFDKLYVSMVKAGEAGGVLDVILNRLAGFMEKSQKLKKKVKGAMIYPAAVITVAVVILIFIMIYVVPSFEAMFKDLGQKLPAPTQILLSTSQTLRGYWYLIPGIPFIFWMLMKSVTRSEKGKLALDRLKLKLPVFGVIIKKSSVSRFCRTLGTLISSGVPILEALKIVKDAIGNLVISNAIEEVHGSIREGDTIAGPLRASGIFDELLVNMIDVGEETGELDKMLIKIADNYETDVDVAVEGMSSLLEPMLIVGMGGVVGFIVIALFLPLIEIIKNIK